METQPWTIYGLYMVSNLNTKEGVAKWIRGGSSASMNKPDVLWRWSGDTAGGHTQVGTTMHSPVSHPSQVTTPGRQTLFCLHYSLTYISPSSSQTEFL